MVHNAFDLVQILKDCPVKIDSVGLWGSRILVGCMDGSLRMYVPEFMDNPTSFKEPDLSSGSYILKDTRIGFAKKAVTSMDVLQSRNLLITLSDTVAVHSLPEFDLVAYLTKTKGANLYAWDERRGMLAVAKAKRLFLYKYDGNKDFGEVKELAAPDVVKCMAWVGDSLCLGIKREYVILNISTGVSFDVFPCGRHANPLAVPLPNGDLLLGKDNIGVVVDHNGKLSHSGEGNLSWSESPTSVVIQPPYALARLSRFIEVRSLRAPFGLVQTLPLRDSHVIFATEAGIIAASDYSIYRLLPVPIGVQVVQLAASGNFEDALALCKLLPPEDAALRVSKEDAIHIRYGQYLFEQQKYTEAMEHFAASSLDLPTILSLFPMIKLPNVGVAKDLPNVKESESGATTPRGSLTPSTSETLEDTAVALQSLALNQGLDSRHRKIALGALATLLLKKRGSVIAQAEAEETEAAVAAMVEVAGATHRRVRSVDKHAEVGEERSARNSGAREVAMILDTALVQALLSTDNLSMALQVLSGPNYADVDACEDVMLEGGHYAELVQLYKSNHKHREALLFLNRLAEHPESFAMPPKNPEQFGPKAIVQYLQALDSVDHDLVIDCSQWLLKSHPEDALNLFVTYDPPLPPSLVLSNLKSNAPNLQIPYLEQIMERRPETRSLELENELVQLYLTKVLDERAEHMSQDKWDEKSHSEARQKLLAALDSSRFNAERVLQRLPVDGLYEERAFLLGRMRQHRLALTLYAHKLHEADLALAYCDRVFTPTASALQRNTASLASLALRPQPKDPAAANIYLILLEVYLKPKAAIQEFDRSIASLAPVRNTINQRTTAAPRAKGIKKIAQIEDDVYFGGPSTDSTPENGRSESESEPLEHQSTIADEGIMLEEALTLLSKRWERMDCAQALRMLPSDTTLQKLITFLEPLLCKSSEAHRNGSVIKNLRRSESLQVREELTECRKRMVRVTTDRTCSICQKRIGNTVFAVYPNGSLAHFVCFRDRQSPKPGAGS
ncbi:vacuolar sorting protein 39 [Physcomitrium patens]|uniref:CNH domain-containing protein n=1 Tax=Physcomitrium patens TaxID=3218 RepID=A0A2K1JXU4_PHYPA|nr:vam6/Vps39-like protein [Physcomitrium patens]XP_024386373.1 vam6/Vps39-like protein [Physcomitrium patens]XP_024386374.1 vam6/Vps39-like protein [Physcomitrium patens]XP_024386375.1 vam6/Vps39-like protein [Physcomitrium patens]PNR46340.1 hypothetical protein PHYPA_013459 [Physcomitrium patens]|eukprot:XP_024386372.1 vam6/Vps39-like protein [Physcomitrella patens]